MGEDDFIIITLNDRADLVATKIIENFETVINQFYDVDVLKRGYICANDEDGKEVQYPLLSVAMGVAIVEPDVYKHYSQVMDKAKSSLKKAKTAKTNSFVKG